MNSNFKKTLVAMAAVFTASAAHAIPITTWQMKVDTRFDPSAVAPGSVAVSNNNKRLRWGTSTGFGRSGLDITNSPVTTFVDTNGGVLVPNVSITHRNRPVTGSSLSSVDIVSKLTLAPSDPLAPALPTQMLTFKVKFLETPNAAATCGDGGANGVGINSAGCADIFVIDFSALNFSFFYPDIEGPDAGTNREYFISFLELTSGLNPLPTAACQSATGSSAPCIGFRTPEDVDTTVQFAASITTRPVTLAVPEPGSLALMGLGLGLLGLLRRRNA